ncbi:MAG TPA: DUF305 domain-containing protein [Microbacteriaceae bacterium]|nr:DUF305 domain-containing protein [Microbacteriaceae bacterium]
MSDGAPAVRRSRWPVAVVGVLAVVIALVAMFWIGRASVVGTVPGSTSADAGFLRDMQTHHQQAVEMAMLMRERTEDADLRAISYDIATAQAQQSGIMYGWLQQWGLDQYGVPMLWMSAADGHDHGAPSGDGGGDAVMPGMATREQLTALQAADGHEAERLFLELMIAHHEGGIEMAEAAVRLATQPIVRDFAAKMITVQSAEIDTMSRMLAER